MGTSPTLSSSGRRSKMDFKDQSTSNNWISLINTVFASIAVLPVFLVWFLGIITDSIEEKENQDDRIIIVEDNDNEESEKSQEEIADRHLYIIPNLRSDSNLLEYKNYCAYQDFQTTPVHEELKQKKPCLDVTGQDASNEDNERAFNWPADSDVIEGLRRFQNQTEISQEMRGKLADMGILREVTDNQAETSDGKIEKQARLSGKSLSRKQIHVIWDNFSSKSRPGLPQEDSSPDQSPSPRSRKPLKKINLEKESKLENKLKQRKYWNNAKSQNNILVRAF